MKCMSKLVSLLMAASILCVGCSSSAQNSQSEEVSSLPSSTTENSQKETSSQAEQEQEPVEISMLAPLFSDPPDMEGPFWTEWQRLTNSKLDIEWVPSGDYDTKLNLKLASDGLPEVTIVNNLSEPVINAIQGGAFWGLSEFLGDMSAYPNLRDNLTPGAYKYTTYEGEIYGIPRSRPQRGCGLKIRKDWLDNLGLPVPTTLDEYTKALKAIVKKSEAKRS